MPQLPCGDQDNFAVSLFSPSTFTRGLRFSLLTIILPFGLVGKAYICAHRERGQEPEAGNVSLTKWHVTRAQATTGNVEIVGWEEATGGEHSPNMTDGGHEATWREANPLLYSIHLHEQRQDVQKGPCGEKRAHLIYWA